MNKKLEKDALSADLASVEAILSSIPENDPLGRIAFEDRRNALRAELKLVEDAPETLANVALFFNGSPVKGSRSIEAEFAAKAIEAYQEIVTKKLASSESGGLALKGPIPSKSASRLNITNVVHGSFGFLLEEDNPESPQLINSSLKEAVDQVTTIFDHFTDPSDDRFSSIIETMDPRLFAAVRSFFKVMHDEQATLRLVEGMRDARFDDRAVERAFLRAEETQIDEEDYTMKAILLGVVPFGRRFDLRSVDTGEIISGKIGPLLSQNYLERIENDEKVIGRRWLVTVHRKFVRKPGNRTQTSYTLLQLVKPE